MRLLCEIVGQNIFASYVRWNGEICQKYAFAKLLSMQSLLVYCFQSKTSWITNVSILLHHEVIPSDKPYWSLQIVVMVLLWYNRLFYALLSHDMLVTITPQWFEWEKNNSVQSFSNITNTWKLIHCYK